MIHLASPQFPPGKDFLKRTDQLCENGYHLDRDSWINSICFSSRKQELTCKTNLFLHHTYH